MQCGPSQGKSSSRAESQKGGNNHRNSSQREASRHPNLCNYSKSVLNSGQRRAALARPWKRRQAARLLRPSPALAPPRVRRLSISAGAPHDRPNTFKTRTPRAYMIHQPHADLGRPERPWCNKAMQNLNATGVHDTLNAFKTRAPTVCLIHQTDRNAGPHCVPLDWF